MLRLYFDSDVINKIRTGKLPELDAVLKRFRSRLLIPYSSAHISDKLPSKAFNEKLFWDDVDYITEFTNSRYIAYDRKKEGVCPFVVSAREVTQNIEESRKSTEEFSSVDNMLKFVEETAEEYNIPELGRTFRSLHEMPWEFGSSETYGQKIQQAADQIHAIRKDATVYKSQRELIQSHIQLPKHASNWQGDVIDKIDPYIKESGLYKNFHDMIEKSFADREKIDRFSYYNQAYYLLGTLGFRPDDINTKNNKGFDNHLQDSIHSFYGAHCDFLVSTDKRLIAKSKVLYQKYNIGTKILSPEELTALVPELLSDNDVKTVVENISKMELVDTLAEDGVDKALFRLKAYPFDYFTHLQYESENEEGITTLLFAKMYDNYSELIFYEEFDQVIEDVTRHFGNESDLEDVIKQFRSENPDDHHQTYYSNHSMIRLTYVGVKFYLWIYLVNEQKLNITYKQENSGRS